jgi:2-polyprenyl-3-methyl-5-hydroxy-6-metoxy-1,4-benzoquinol methylase
VKSGAQREGEHAPQRIHALMVCREGVLEHYWGEHIHLGYYSDEERKKGYKKKDFKKAKHDFVYEMLKFGHVRNPKRILDVGCGFGGTSRMLAREFPEAEVQGATLHITKSQLVFRSHSL